MLENFVAHENFGPVNRSAFPVCQENMEYEQLVAFVATLQFLLLVL